VEGDPNSEKGRKKTPGAWGERAYGKGVKQLHFGKPWCTPSKNRLAAGRRSRTRRTEGERLARKQRKDKADARDKTVRSAGVRGRLGKLKGGKLNGHVPSEGRRNLERVEHYIHETHAR